jgi:hypothetical protein
MAKTADPVFRVRGLERNLAGLCLDRLRVWRLWRRTRCALTNGVGASHVVVDIRLAKKRRDGAGLRRLGSDSGLAPNTRNGVRARRIEQSCARPCAANGNGHTDPWEADPTRAGRTQARRPRQFGLN